MALPSSPPLLPTPGAFSIEPHLPLLRRPSSRKRQLSDYNNLSSDPLFSEDASEADVQDYFQLGRRKKRVVRGPWWKHGNADVAAARREKGTMKSQVKNVDSGVWMWSDVSDDTIASSDCGTPASEWAKTTSLPNSTGPATSSFSSATPDHLADRIVDACLDHNDEVVDLSDLGLTILPGATLQPLHNLVRAIHRDNTQPPSEEEYAPLKPSIKLFLSGNHLTTLPRELFMLDTISVLSLRNNNLGELPDAICRLSHLKELNVAGNGLKWLPWELFKFFECRRHHVEVTVRPNPLLELPRLMASADVEDPLNPGVASTSPGLLNRALLAALDQKSANGESTACGSCLKNLTCLAASMIIRFDVNGTISNHGHGRGLEQEEMFTDIESSSTNKSQASTSVPSLFELALRETQNAYDLCNVSDDTFAEIPAHLRSAITLAAENLEHGNPRCTTCRRQYVVPRAEWVEYWFVGSVGSVLDEQSVLPFLRKACSWACAQPSVSIMAI